ncbi:hypothetical protein HN803_08255 [candidate division WWE3 bacterium]|jgi:regulator of sigma E protease|nr:hypothetical protein [candidate division WWE3 bacterium]MBT7350743.1 hypothetical protein [candidate division WWE3 bacterium]
MLTTLILILILSVLVLAHEFGHFHLARKNDVRVEEFGWGLPPRAWGKKIGETIYSINWLPFGGFVKLTGEDFDEDPKAVKDPRSFANKKPSQRAAILVAGVVMNVIVAIFIYLVLFFMTNFKTMTLPLFFDYDFAFGNQENTNTVITNFVEGSTLDGVAEVGEAIIEIDGSPVYNVADVREALEDKDGIEVSLLLMDIRPIERTFRGVRAIPQANEEGNVLLGVALSPGFRLHYHNRILAAPQHSYNILAYSLSTLGGLVKESFEAGDIAPLSASVSGPVGVFSTLDSIIGFSGKEALVGILDLSALLSLSLALLNILPFPALDGGRLFFVLYEMISGKKVKPEIEGNLHRWGMLALLALIILVTVKDVRNLL